MLILTEFLTLLLMTWMQKKSARGYSLQRNSLQAELRNYLESFQIAVYLILVRISG